MGKKKKSSGVPTVHWTATIDKLRERELLEPIVEIIRSNHATMEEVCNRSKTLRIVAARHAAWFHLRSLGFSYPEIGKLWSVDHTTVLSATKKIKP